LLLKAPSTRTREVEAAAEAAIIAAGGTGGSEMPLSELLAALPAALSWVAAEAPALAPSLGAPRARSYPEDATGKPAAKQIRVRRSDRLDSNCLAPKLIGNKPSGIVTLCRRVLPLSRRTTLLTGCFVAGVNPQSAPLSPNL